MFSRYHFQLTEVANHINDAIKCAIYIYSFQSLRIKLILETNYEYVEIKCQLDVTEVFIADLIACSTCFGHQYVHHQELKSIIQWLLPVVFRAVIFKLLVWCGAEGYVSGLQDAAVPHQTSNLKITARNSTGSNHCIMI